MMRRTNCLVKIRVAFLYSTPKNHVYPNLFSSLLDQTHNFQIPCIVQTELELDLAGARKMSQAGIN